ncbi:MAG TPA: hypothetical protein DD990_04735, partial [Cyanobacteria bacterium UBA11368]|nr:hypothetical protein [Cyanobacteria bacterium UBA11368]
TTGTTGTGTTNGATSDTGVGGTTTDTRGGLSAPAPYQATSPATRDRNSNWGWLGLIGLLGLTGLLRKPARPVRYEDADPVSRTGSRY